MTEAKRLRPPIVLIVDDQEWSTRSLESILAPNGFAVMRAYTAKSGLERALAHSPDAVFVNESLPDGSGLTLCRTLRQEQQIGAETPIFTTSPERPTRALRLESFRAGAWDVLAYPIDGEELVLRLDAYVQAKLAADRLREQGLIDGLTGLYNLHGLERRMAELISWAYREQSALACVVFAPVDVADDEDRAVARLVGQVAGAFRTSGRISDIIGRLGKTEIAVLAPNTDRTGAVSLAERLGGAISESGPVPGGIELRAGYDAVSDARESASHAKDLLIRATLALRKAKANGNGWVQPYEEFPSRTSGAQG
jgi:diguanylate cyclase (GGDEF)-like protein